MIRPRLFLSAVSEELRTVRQSVAATVRTLGFDPVSQDDFPTGYGELREWLREQVNSCEGLIQLVGQAYGAEPSNVDPEYGRVSYTQFEFLYARKRNKKTWVIVIGKDFELDKPIAEQDLPRTHDHSDPFGYQIERRSLQQNYLSRLNQDNHLRHTANNGTELQNIILRLRDDLGELRRGGERRERRLTKAVISILLGLVILGGGGWWGYHQLQRGVQQVSLVNTEKIRAHLLQTTEETHRRELTEAEAATDWKRRQELRDAANHAHSIRLSRIEELAASFAEIEGRGTSTGIFQEMTRILSEQGVDEAISYVGAQRPSILQTVRTRATVAREHNRADLQPLLRAAALQQAKGEATEARNLYTDIFAVEPDWPDALHAFFWFLTDQGDLARVHTTLVETKREYEEAHRMAQRLTTSDPGNTDWQRDLSVSYEKLGDVAVAQGKLDEAAKAYRDSLAIRKQLAASDPGNTGWQRDLSVSYERLGDVAVTQGNLDEATEWFQKSRLNWQDLQKKDPTNADWQRGITIPLNQLGDVAVAQGKLDEAAKAYRDSLAIAKSLAASDPGNTDWQRDLSVSYSKLGNVAVAQGKLDEAAKAYRDSLAIRKQLAASDPGNTGRQRDLSVSYERLGDVAVAQGKLDEAAKAYRDSLAIAKSLAASDPSNTQWQRDLSVSYAKLASLTELRKKTGESRAYWKQAFDVLSEIDKRGLHLSPKDREVLKILRQKAGVDAS